MSFNITMFNLIDPGTDRGMFARNLTAQGVDVNAEELVQLARALVGDVQDSISAHPDRALLPGRDRIILVVLDRRGNRRLSVWVLPLLLGNSARP